MIFKQFTHDKIRLLLVFFLFFTIACLFAIYFYEKFSSDTLIIKDIKIDSQAALVLNTMHQTSTNNGVKEWTIDASKARLFKNRHKVVMDNVSIVFFTKNSQKIYLSSNHGTFDTQTHDMIFSGNVVIKHAGYILKTESLHYEQKKHIIYSRRHVSIKDKNSIIDGDSLEMELDKSRTILKGNVKGLFSENSDFFQKNL